MGIWGFLNFQGVAAWGSGNDRRSVSSTSAPSRVNCVTSLSLSFPMCLRDGPRVDQDRSATVIQVSSEANWGQSPGARGCLS